MMILSINDTIHVFLFQQEEMEQINQRSGNTLKNDKKQVVFIEVHYFTIFKTIT